MSQMIDTGPSFHIMSKNGYISVFYYNFYMFLEYKIGPKSILGIVPCICIS